MRVASGTSTPTSMTVVATSSGARPAEKSSMIWALSAVGVRPVSSWMARPASAGWERR